MSPTPFLYLVTSLRHYLIVSKPPLTKHESPATSHQALNGFFSYSCGLTYTTANTQSLSFQSLPHFFHRDGGCTPLACSNFQFRLSNFRLFSVFAFPISNFLFPISAFTQLAQGPRSRLPPPPTAQSSPATAPPDRCSSSGQASLPPPPAARS